MNAFFSIICYYIQFESRSLWISLSPFIIITIIIIRLLLSSYHLECVNVTELLAILLLLREQNATIIWSNSIDV